VGVTVATAGALDLGVFRDDVTLFGGEDFDRPDDRDSQCVLRAAWRPGPHDP